MRRLLTVTALLLLTLGLSTPGAAAEPQLTVVAPQDGAVIRGPNVTVEFNTSDITLVESTVPLEQAGQRPDANRPGEGHVHFMLDLQPLVVWEQDAPYTFTNVPPGEHQLMVELVQNDHGPLAPPVAQQIRFRTMAYVPNSGAAPLALSRLAGGLLGLAALATVGGGLLRRSKRRHA
ncbi:MAG: hypothetical protein ACRDJN_21560 [Chloroflexota bacterium]